MLGFLNPLLYYLVLFKAYSLLPAQIAQPLNYTWPLILVILSIIFLSKNIRSGNFGNNYKLYRSFGNFHSRANSVFRKLKVR
ncbi:MAG: EamA family transporter, partial [Bacteroidales bacterium]|nr:EamA family transporter [Bacteroidales bacterium]